MIFWIAAALGGCGGSGDGDPADAARRYEDCYQPDLLTSPDVAGHRCTWLHEALSLQEHLDRDRPLGQTQWHATHNSFNAAAYTGVGYFDFNQQVSIHDQLTLGVRTLELDIHWYPNDATGGEPAPVLCHAQGAELFHLGCTTKARLLEDGVREIADFLAEPGHEDVVLIVGIEDALAAPDLTGGSHPVPEGHDQTVAIFEEILGTDLHHPPQDGECHPLRGDLSKAAVRAAGARVILASGCGEGAAWRATFFDESGKKKGNDGFTPYPDCESSFFGADDYATRWTRVWEDSTFLSKLIGSDLDPVDPATLAAMRSCPLNESAIDQLRPDDARAAAMVWSWAPGEPRAGTGARCAVSGADGHFRSDDCRAEHPAACRVGEGWRISAATGSWGEASAGCASEGAGSFSTPYRGFDNQALMDAKRAAGVTEVWLAYGDPRGRGEWTLGAE
ncbi:MAG: hypothetical protein IPK07_04650 [Deltaproteobacteria bacterium]|nr:hypothetical protein [Deltaproteobacteria bacterium]